jgi:hypothetical protein
MISAGGSSRAASQAAAIAKWSAKNNPEGADSPQELISRLLPSPTPSTQVSPDRRHRRHAHRGAENLVAGPTRIA